MVQTIKCRDAGLLDGYTVYLSDQPVISLGCLAHVTRRIENRTDLVCTENRISGCSQLCTVRYGSDGDLSHLTDLLLKSHLLQDLLNLCLNRRITWNCRSDRRYPCTGRSQCRYRHQ